MQVRSSALLAALVAIACSGSRPHLPALTERYRHADNTITFELPDSGGFLANGVPVARSRIASVVAEAFAGRRPEIRALFVVDNPARDWSDVEMIQTTARAAGGEAFDAAASGRVPAPKMTELPTIERR